MRNNFFVFLRQHELAARKRMSRKRPALLEATAGEEEPRQKRGRYDRSNAVGKKSAGKSAYEHRVKAENFMTDASCPKSCRLGFKCARLLTRECMIKAHEEAYGTDVAMCTNGVGQSPVYTGKLTCGQVVARQAQLATRGLASYADGNGYVVDDRGPVCADFYRHAYGIPLCAWNKTSAALYGDRPINGLNQLVPPRPPRPPPRPPPPRPLPTGSRALLAVLPPAVPMIHACVCVCLLYCMLVYISQKSCCSVCTHAHLSVSGLYSLTMLHKKRKFRTN